MRQAGCGEGTVAALWAQREGREEGWAGEGSSLAGPKEGSGRGYHSLQFISSEASSQSTNWLQRLEFPMQVPSRQRNSPTPQAVSRTVPTRYHQAKFSLWGPGGHRPDLLAQNLS